LSVRVGVIGCGWWATYAHLPALAGDERATIAALADPDAERLAAAARRFEVDRTFASADAMLDATELDAAVIAVPHAAHYEMARLALQHDLHVLLEKPMVIDPEDGRRLVEQARERRRELIVGYPWHYNEQALAAKAWLAEGRIESVEYASCLFASKVRELYAGRPESYREEFGYPVNAPREDTYSDPALAGGGQAQTNLTHAAALLLWMTGLEVERVSAMTASFELVVDLADAVALQFGSGAIGSLGSTGSMLAHHEELLEYRIFGTGGHVVFDVGRGRLHLHTRSGIEQAPLLAEADRYPEGAPVRNLVGAALGTDVNGSPAELGLAVVELVDAIYRSAAGGCVVELARAEEAAAS